MTYGPPRSSAPVLSAALATSVAVFAAPYLPAQDKPPAAPPDAPAAPAGTVDFVKDVQPVLKAACLKCHGPEKQKGKLRLDVRALAMKGGESGPAIVPGKSAESLLVLRLRPYKDKDIMPKEGKPLSEEKAARIAAWIDQGAGWPDAAAGLDVKLEKHWAYVKPVPPKVPHPDDNPKSEIRNPQFRAWVRNPIDAFVLDGLAQEKLSPSPEASKETLLRRASLDLIGLPPTIGELDAFLTDASPDAYERAVDRLLASPHFGERWARPWLDAARYADTNGYEKDLIRTNWPWRDWVIRALNDDMPFDRFTIEQLAGDILPNPTREQLIATGFNRNTLLNDEGGVDFEEFRAAAIMDRIDTMGAVWLGTTIGCCQCHSHKYDPFTNKEYYQLFAFFNQSEDTINNNPAPFLDVPSPEQQAKLDTVRKEIADLEAQKKAADDNLPAALTAWEAGMKEKPLASSAPRGMLAHYALDETAGTLVGDSTGGRPPGEVKGPAGASQWVPGKSGNALKLDGKGGFVDCGPVAGFDRRFAFSYGCWVNWDGKDGAFISKMDEADSFRGFDVMGGNHGRVQVHLVAHWPDDAIAVSTKEPIPPGTWAHVMVVYGGNGNAGGLKVYVNGKPAAVDVSVDALRGSMKTSVPLHLGARKASVFLNGTIDDVRIYPRALTAKEVAQVLDEPLLILAVPAEKRTDAQKAELAAYFRDNHYETRRRLIDAVAAQKATETRLLEQVPKTMIMRERKEPRETHVLVRGNWAQPGDKVEAATPDALHPFPAGLPRNRLGLAKWLVSPENPLAGRVVMNRFWREIFGRGLVETVEDFGTQGERPTHPELLDWLATEFVRTGWDVKAMLKTIVTSATYRQSSAVSPELFARDQYNVLLARGPRFRPDAETVRDLALRIGGLLTPTIGGPSVFPPQPPGIWENSFSFYDTKDRWVDETGPNRYRRGLYTFWRRSAPYPTSLTFDVTTRDVCVVKRNRTNTPLQALDTLNNPVFYECAAALGKRMMTEAKGDATEKIAYGFRLCTARRPKPEEVKRLDAVYRAAPERFAKDEKAAAALIAKGRLEAGTLDPKELAAWIVVGNVLLNLDETLTKN